MIIFISWITFFLKDYVKRSVLIIVTNVLLKRMEMSGRGDLARRIDNYSEWFFPIAYIIAGALVVWLFIINGSNPA